MVRLLPGHRPGGHLVLPVAVGFVLGSFFSFLTLTHNFNPSPSLSRCRRFLTSGQGSCIPPVVHFVQLKEDESSALHFSFEAFLALYSAHLFIRPSVIYIHTDFSPKEVVDAAQNGSSWTRKLLTAFPDTLRFNAVTAPATANGHDITRPEHKSAFVRLDQLAAHGGVYLDWDVLTLRSLDPLLDSGFKAVLARQPDDAAAINSAVMLASKDSAVTRIMRTESPRAFDGDGWTTRGAALLSRAAQAAAQVPREVLIMGPGLFAPFGRTREGVDAAHARHEGDAMPVRHKLDAMMGRGMPPADPVAAWERSNGAVKKAWARDLNDAFFLHNNFKDFETPKGFNGVTVPYVLARDSNYALAAWPIVQQGIKDGHIDENDSSL